MKKLPILILILILLGGIYFAFNWNKNNYSKESLKLEILGPNDATLSQEVEYLVKYKNNGNFRLENPELIFVPPENSAEDGNILERQVLGTEKLGQAIYPGEEKSFSFKVRLLGEEGEAKTAKAYLSYQPKELKARYESSTSLTTVIKSVPLTFEFDLPSKIELGKDFNFRINYFSNIDYPLTNLRCQLEYPFGFEFGQANPKSIDKTDWEIPVLNKSEGGRIEVSGKITGEVGNVKIFKAKLGIWKNGEFILLKEAEKGIEIIKPSLYLRQEINGNPQYAASPGDWLHYQVYFKNIGDEALTNLFLVNKLEGELFDFKTMKSDSGNFQSGDNSIIFDWRKAGSLSYLIPMDEGKVDFWIKLKDDLGNIKNPTLKNTVFISQAREEFVTKVGSKIEMAQRGYFQDEVFGNSGPIPPKVGDTTSYTIAWQVKNYSEVKNVRVRAVLPENVILTGKIFPESETSKFSFDSQSREIVWSLGDLRVVQGSPTSSPSISFQVAFTPENSQMFQTPQIIGEAKITGEDVWTETILESTSPAIKTDLPDDETITPGLGIVQP